MLRTLLTGVCWTSFPSQRTETAPWPPHTRHFRPSDLFDSSISIKRSSALRSLEALTLSTFTEVMRFLAKVAKSLRSSVRLSKLIRLSPVNSTSSSGRK